MILRLAWPIFIFGLSIFSESIAQSFWRQSNGPYGGEVTAFAINSDGHIFAGTRGGGVFRSTDNGASWTAANAGLTSTRILALAISSSGSIFAGTEDGGVFQSPDNGATWIPKNNGLTVKYVIALAITSEGYILAGVGNAGGAFRSTDNGNSWAPVDTRLAGFGVWAFAIKTNAYIFAGTSFGYVYRSADNGATWTLVNIEPAFANVRALAVDSQGLVFAGTQSDGIFRTMDDGKNWVSVNNGLTNLEVRALAINSEGTIFAGTQGGIFRSADNGENWRSVNAGLANLEVRSLFINSRGDILAGTQGSGVFRSMDNGNGWAPVSIGLSNTFIWALAISSNGTIWAGTRGGSGVFRSSDNGNSWTPAGLTNDEVWSLAISSNQIIFAGTDSSVFRSMDDGQSWAKVNSSFSSETVLSLIIKSDGTIFAGTSGRGVFRSIDNGASWTPVNNGLTSTVVWAFAAKSNAAVFAGTADGIFRSLNDGAGWTKVSNGLPPNTTVWSLSINANGHLFAGTFGQGIFRSINNGDQWTEINTGLSNMVVRAVVINSDGIVLAGTQEGVFSSLKNGDSWTAVNAGLTNPNVLSFAINSPGEIFAGTGGGGVFRGSPPVLEHTYLSFQDAGKAIAVTADIVDDTGISRATLNYRQGGTVKFTVAPMSGSGNAYRGIIPADSVAARGIEYFLEATDAGGFTVRKPSSGMVSVQIKVPEPGAINLTPQPNGTAQTAFRLISVPLDLDDKNPQAVLADDLGPYDRKKWRFFAPLDDTTYVEYTDSLKSGALKMSPGKAFWLIVKDPDQRIDTGAGQSISTSRAYPIALHPGWNYIGNPFSFAISADSARLRSSSKSPVLRFYNGDWNDVIQADVKQMRPFDGYAVFNPDPTRLDTLLIDPRLSSSANFFPPRSASGPRDNILWLLRILAQCQEARDVDNVAAIVSGASSSWDDLDQPEPPVIGEYVSVYFPHPEWNKLAKTYCTDVRPMTSDDGLRTSDGEIWPFEVKTNIRDKVNLTFEGLDGVPPELEVWLVDDALKITQNLREQGQYAVAGAGAEHPKQLKLVVGKRSFVDEKLAEAQAIPTTYELSQNFPNPFNPATTIRYGLPSAERVMLKIYNLLGAEVTTLVDNEPKAAGYHAAIWDGRDKNGRVVASGVYVYRMKAGSFSKSKKLALLR